ncbi:MAG TPA: hypothetical protein VN669_12125 [Candidatus Acidoferrales bacterium]|jgi:hypothetical protein|nr:hypothetical protein [Candidatus Acidoferrales bacterium]
MQQISSLVQGLSFAGALLILVGYAGEQFGWLSSRRPLYNTVNAIGSLILGIIALRPFQLGFVILEFTWAGISLFALARTILQKRPA